VLFRSPQNPKTPSSDLRREMICIYNYSAWIWNFFKKSLIFNKAFSVYRVGQSSLSVCMFD
jgi:hypothetical protein